MSKTGNVYKIRDGVYAYGEPGKRATGVVAKTEGGIWTGVRGVKPVIHFGATEGAPEGAIAKLAALGA